MANELPLRGALIGCGYFGQIQLDAWRRMEGVEIVAACDPRAEAAENPPREPTRLPKNSWTASNSTFIEL